MQTLGSLIAVLIAGQTVSLPFSEDLVDTDGYAMETSVYPAEGTTPILKTTTVFQGDRAYDVVHGASRNIACFDFKEQMIFLLEPQQKKRTSVPFTDVLRFQSELRKRAFKHEGLASFLAGPSFIRELDANKSIIKLSSPWITYEAKGRTTTAYHDVERFVNFANWSARLAGMLNPAAPPASARIELNNALLRQNWLVKQITRSGGPKAKALGMLRSEHHYRDELSDDDFGLIQTVKKNLKEFEQFSFSEFRNIRNSARAVTKK